MSLLKFYPKINVIENILKCIKNGKKHQPKSCVSPAAHSEQEMFLLAQKSENSRAARLSDFLILSSLVPLSLLVLLRPFLQHVTAKQSLQPYCPSACGAHTQIYTHTPFFSSVKAVKKKKSQPAERWLSN